MDTDLEAILAPIPGESDVGVNLRLLPEEDARSGQYLALKSLRNEQRRAERKNIEVEHNLIIDGQAWREVINLSTELLSSHTKDVEITAWLVEGLVRVDGFKGLSRALNLFSTLILYYGQRLYPPFEDDDPESRLASISMLGGKYEVGTLVTPLYYHPVIPTLSGSHLNAWDVRQCLEKSGSNVEDLRAQALLEQEEIRAAVLEIDKEAFAQICSNLQGAFSFFEKFNSALSKIFSGYAPNLSGLKSALQYCLRISTSLSEHLLGKVEGAAAAEASQQLPGSAGVLRSGPLDRAAAAKLLEGLVDFFAETEPHSPISHALKRAARWINADAAQIASETMSEAARREYCKITGVPFLKSAAADKSGPSTRRNEKKADDYEDDEEEDDY